MGSFCGPIPLSDDSGWPIDQQEVTLQDLQGEIEPSKSSTAPSSFASLGLSPFTPVVNQTCGSLGLMPSSQDSCERPFVEGEVECSTPSSSSSCLLHAASLLLSPISVNQTGGSLGSFVGPILPSHDREGKWSAIDKEGTVKEVQDVVVAVQGEEECSFCGALCNPTNPTGPTRGPT